MNRFKVWLIWLIGFVIGVTTEYDWPTLAYAGMGAGGIWVCNKIADSK